MFTAYHPALLIALGLAIVGGLGLILYDAYLHFKKRRSAGGTPRPEDHQTSEPTATVPSQPVLVERPEVSAFKEATAQNLELSVMASEAYREMALSAMRASMLASTRELELARARELELARERERLFAEERNHNHPPFSGFSGTISP